MADDLRHARGSPERAGAGHPLREHSEEEVGCQLRLHGPLRLRRRRALLGVLGLQDVVRGRAAAVLGEGRTCVGAEVSPQGGGPPQLHAQPLQRHARDPDDCTVVPDGDDGVVPVRVRRHHVDLAGRIGAWEDELQGVDDVRAAVADVLLHSRCV